MVFETEQLQKFFLNLLDYQDSDTCSKKDNLSTKWFVVVESFGLKFCRTKSSPSLWRGETLMNIGFLKLLALSPHDQFIKNQPHKEKTIDFPMEYFYPGRKISSEIYTKEKTYFLGAK